MIWESKSRPCPISARAITSKDKLQEFSLLGGGVFFVTGWVEDDDDDRQVGGNSDELTIAVIMSWGGRRSSRVAPAGLLGTTYWV